jgi:hypothetical protein
LRFRARWIAAGSLALALSLPSVAAAELISIGTLEWGSSLEFLPWPDPSGTGYNILPIVGTDARVANASPVSFVNLALRADWSYLSTHAWDTCYASTLAPGASFECGTGPVTLAPALPNGIGYMVSVTGDLRAPSFLLADGSTFVATSTAFSRQYSWSYTTQGPPAIPILDILIEGTIVPPSPIEPVPEPRTMWLLVGGALTAYGARRRLAPAAPPV